MPAKSPADQLKEWTDKLAANQSQNADLTRDIDRLKNQIADLSKTISDVGQKKQAWATTAETATEQQAALQTYVNTNTKMLEATVADPQKIKDAIKQAKTGLDDLKKAVDDANTAATGKQGEWAKAKVAAVDAANSYSAYAGLAAANDALLKDVASLRDKTDKEGVNNVARKYSLVLVMNDVLQALNLPPPDAYAAELSNRASALSAASQDEKLAKIAADKAAADAAEAQKTLDDARASWRQKLLESIPSGGAAARAPAPEPQH
jgi:hypothetical protein